MANQNVYPYYPEGAKNAVEPWRTPGSGAPPPMGYAPGQVYYAPSPYVQAPMAVHVIPMSFQSPEVAAIRDWLPWSIVNFFIGFIGGGILPLIFSLICRSHKQANNAQGARTMSILALIFNILITLTGIGIWIYIIVLIAAIGSVFSPLCTSIYCS